MADLAPADDKSGDGKDASDAELLKAAKDNHKLCADAWSDNRKAWLEDAKFREPGKGNQWPEEVRRIRERAGRPCVEVDKLNQYVRQVVNDGRQNRPGVKVRPEGEGAHADVAEAYDDLIRGICARSNADEAFDTSLDHASGNGYGFFRIVTEYAYPGTFNQEIKIKRVRNPRAVLLDPYIQTADGSDARFGFVEEDIPKDEFKRQYPKAKHADWVGDKDRYGGDGWLTEKSVRVCEYWYKVETPELVHLLADGTTVADDDYQAAIKELTPGTAPPQIKESRELPTCEVRWCRMSGAEILEKKDWLGQYIPLLLVIGNESDIDGKVTYSGLIRPAKDAMRLYNYSRSAYAERVALTPKAPFIAAAGQVENHPEWQDANTENYSVLVYDPIDVNGNPVAPPQRQPASDIPAGFAQDMQLSEHDIQGSMGMYNASLGEKSNEKSGRAITARQREGDTSTFHYPDNLNRAIRYLGRQLVDLIPKIYDSARVIHLLAEDGTPSTAQISPEQDAPVTDGPGGKKIYNLGVGVYGVDVTSGPSYTTKRQEAVEAQMQLVQSAPETMQFAGDLIVKNMDWPGADALAERYKLMLPPPIQQAIAAKDQGQDPKVLAAVAPLQQGLQQAQQQIKDAEAGIAERDQALHQLQQKVDASANTAEANQLKSQVESEKLAVERDRVQLERQKIEADERGKVLDSETKLRVAQISAGLPPETPVEQQQRIAQESMSITQLAQIIAGSHAQLMDVLGQHAQTMQAVAQALTRPKVATMPDGRQISVQ